LQSRLIILKRPLNSKTVQSFEDVKHGWRRLLLE
jgi:hypothetical protein